MSITATELKNNLSYYLTLSLTEDIYITKNGKVVSKLSNPSKSKWDSLHSLIGIISSDGDDEINAKEERLNRQ
ncbi:MAG: type II toxin-antitoxin system Phd/YefM family antitoxin [Lachnospiraceae bacterium]